MKHVNINWVIVYFLTFLLPGCRKEEDKTHPIDIDPPTTSVVPCPGRPIIDANLVPVGSISLERSEIKSATAGSKILFVGSNNSNPNTNPSLAVDIYDFVADTWTTTSLKGNYREGCAITSLGDKIFIAGGSDYMDASRVDIYDASSNSWSEARL